MSNTTPQGGRPQNVLFEDILLNFRQVEQFAIESNPDVSTTSKLVDMVATKEVRSGNRKAEFYRYGVKYMYQTIVSRTASGSNLILGFADSQFEGFSEGESIRCTSEVVAVVVAIGPGTATIRPLSGETFVAADFVIGQETSTIGVISDTQNSDSTETTLFLPFQDYNYIEESRKSVSVFTEDLWSKTWLKDGSGEFFFARQNQLNTLNYLMKQANKRVWVGQRKADGTRYYSGGFKWQIKNQGGVYRGTPSALSETEFQGVFDELKRNGGTRSETPMMLGGYGYLTQFQNNVGKQYILPAGIRNTIGGGEVKGINMNQYAYGGWNIKIAEEPMLSAPGIFAEEGISTINSANKISNACLILDTSPVQGDGGNLSWVRKMYFGAEGLQRTTYEGTNDMNGNASTRSSSGKRQATEDYIYECCTQLSNPTAHAYHFIST